MLDYFNKFYLHQRFFPGFMSIFINPFYFIRKRLVEKIKLPAIELKGDLLDFGCGAKPYRKLFYNVKNYIGIDIENEGHDHNNEEIDMFYDGKHIPFENESFDSILASEVLEHVPNVDESLKELCRVLKTDGKLLLTVPFLWQEHELPFDFRRFSSIGICQYLKENGFRILSIEKTGHFMEVIVQLWMIYLRRLFYVKNKYINLLLNMIFISPVCLIGFILSLILPQKEDLYFNTVVLAQKIS